MEIVNRFIKRSQVFQNAKFQVGDAVKILEPGIANRSPSVVGKVGKIESISQGDAYFEWRYLVKVNRTNEIPIEKSDEDDIIQELFYEHQLALDIPPLKYEGKKIIAYRSQAEALRDLDDEDKDVRYIATSWIGKRGDINLITRMLDDRDEDVRSTATYWIGEKGDINLITRMLDDEDRNVRSIATYWIEKRKDEIRKEPLDIPPLKYEEEIISDYPTQAKLTNYRTKMALSKSISG